MEENITPPGFAIMLTRTVLSIKLVSLQAAMSHLILNSVSHIILNPVSHLILPLIGASLGLLLLRPRSVKSYTLHGRMTQ